MTPVSAEEPCSVQPHRDRSLHLLAASGLLGFLLAAVGYPTWQVAVESAQVLAGVVQYPTETPFYMYHVKLWTLSTQIGAIFLAGGVTERTLSIVISGLLGMLNFQGLALCVFALSRHFWLSLATPFLMLWCFAAGYGVLYPISLLGSQHTYGVLGLAWIVLVVGLVANQRYKLAALLLGVAPAIHASLGAWCWILVVTCILWDRSYRRNGFRAALPYFLAGAAVTIASFAFQRWISRGLPEVTFEVAHQYLSAFVRNWDVHRRPLPLGEPGVFLTSASFVVSLAWLCLFERDLVPRSVLFLLRALVVSALLAAAAAVPSWLPPERIPTALLVTMPTRIMNLNVLVFMPLVVGLLGLDRWDRRSQVTLALLVTAHALLGRSGFTPSIMMAAVLLQLLWRLNPRWALDRKNDDWLARRARAVTFVVLGAVTLAVFIDAAENRGRVEAFGSFDLSDRTNNAFFQRVSQGGGTLLICSDMYLVQLRTRRPVLLESIDALPYALQSGPEMDRILKKVYGIDLFYLPPKKREQSTISPEVHKPLWESRDRQLWTAIAKEFAVSDILTYSDWRLDLPETVRNEKYVLYHIPR